MFRELDDELNRHLAMLADLARDPDDRLVSGVTRAQLPRVVDAVATLLGEHSPDAAGRCASCRPDHWWQPRPAFPCPAYLAVHRALFAGTLG
jgi:hypothetical protein